MNTTTTTMTVRDLDYDPETQTLRMDDGSRESIFVLDECPRCGGHLAVAHHDPSEGVIDFRIDVAVCMASGCGFVATREPDDDGGMTR